MKAPLSVVVLVAVLWVGVVSAPLARGGAKVEAVCPVCRVTEGASEPEEVKAHATHNGKQYGLCSKKCKKEFDEDPEAYLPPVFPRPAPASTVTDEQGKAVDVSRAFNGKLVLVDFWASWCAPCLKAMPDLMALQAKYGERGFTVVGVSIDDPEPARKKAAELARERGLTYPVYYDTAPDAVFDAYRVKVIPAAFLLDAQGQVVAQWSGKVEMAAVESEVARRLSAPRP